ncbi:MAG: GGDEF domain-containing protein [Phreatobacter sp.]
MRRSAEILRFGRAATRTTLDPRDERLEAAPSPQPFPSVIRRLAAEVDRLRDELEQSRRHVRDLEMRSEQDSLCPVLNRRGFDRELGRALDHVRRYGGSLAVAFLDLDGFKPINDRHGHAAGDALLVQVAETLLGAIRSSDSVARLGGDEFALVLWNLGAETAAVKAQSIEAVIAATPARVGVQALVVGASCGIALARPGDTAASLTARADLAMYARKAERKSIMAHEGPAGAESPSQAMISGVRISSR